MVTLTHKKWIVFDIDGTLIHYYTNEQEFKRLLKKAVSTTLSFLQTAGFRNISKIGLWERVESENREQLTGEVRLLENRLQHVFQLDPKLLTPSFQFQLAKQFLQPFFTQSRLYSEVQSVLSTLKQRKFTLAILANTLWDSPTELWKQELQRYEISHYFEHMFFARDIGWRKPAAKIFEHLMNELAVTPEEILVVGDDPREDIIGANKVGIDAVLVDRHNQYQHMTDYVITNLRQLLV